MTGRVEAVGGCPIFPSPSDGSGPWLPLGYRLRPAGRVHSGDAGSPSCRRRGCTRRCEPHPRRDQESYESGAVAPNREGTRWQTEKMATRRHWRRNLWPLYCSPNCLWELFSATKGGCRRCIRLPLGCHLGCQTTARSTGQGPRTTSDLDLLVEARRIELPNLLHAMQALYQLSYAPRCPNHNS
jgi:hypothetical protein